VTTHLRPGVLFDVDGTLLDTNYLHAVAWSRALRDAGEWAPMNAIHRLVGMGGDQLVLRLLGRPSPEAVGFSQHELSEAGARHVYRDMQELLDQVFTSALAQLFPGRGFGPDEPKLAE
jgi:phosphoglycolate phosphatase-like HAD superfamily hydrolase